MEKKPLRGPWSFPKYRCACGMGFQDAKAYLLHRERCVKKGLQVVVYRHLEESASWLPVMCLCVHVG